MNRTYTIVQTLLRHGEEGFSRNKNFEAYKEPEVQRAVRIFRHLRSVRDDLLRVGDGVTLEALGERPDGALTLRLTFDGGAAGRRMTVLDPMEWELLLEDERLVNVLGGLIAQLADDDRLEFEGQLAAW
jgi:hypothetical protein